MKRREVIALGLLGILGTMTGCGSKAAPSNTVTNFTLTSNQVAQVMYDNGCVDYRYSIRDAKYSLPTRDYISGPFSDSLRSFLFQLNSNQWKTDQNDCDDFSIAALFLMSFLHHNTVNKVTSTGIAFGEFHYIRDIGGAHAINVAIVRESDKLKLVFYEPQTYSIVDLSKQEIESCVFWRF
jgi:hypothetical protein